MTGIPGAISAECNTGRHLECQGCPCQCHSASPGWRAGAAIAADPEDGPFPHWHVPGYCHDAGTILPRHEPRPAEYWWLAPNGYWFAKCAECCARDRALAAEWPDLAPLRITQLAGRTS